MPPPPSAPPIGREPPAPARDYDTLAQPTPDSWEELGEGAPQASPDPAVLQDAGPGPAAVPLSLEGT
eukprot:12104624-Alexandrium_andersonii.AAC.1